VLAGASTGQSARRRAPFPSWEGGRGEDADVAGAGAARVGRDEQSGVSGRVVLAVLGLFKLRCAVKPRFRRWRAWRDSNPRAAA
jgi:hypothetical protein